MIEVDNDNVKAAGRAARTVRLGHARCFRRDVPLDDGIITVTLDEVRQVALEEVGASWTLATKC